MTTGLLAARILIALVVVNAAAGIAALVVTGDKQAGDFEAHIFFTTVAVSLTGFSVLPCALAWERRTLHPFEAFSLLTIALSLLALCLLVALIWTDDPSRALDRTTPSILLVSLAAALVNLLSLARLRRSYEWVRLNAYGLSALLAAEAIAVIWSDDPSGTSIRLLIGTGILLAAAGVTLPVLQRIGVERAETTGYDVRFCPSCGRPLGDEPGVSCTTCGASFSVEFR